MNPTAPALERQQEPRVQVKRHPSISSSVGSDVSTMSPPRSPLANFQIGSLSPRQNINPLASLESYRTDGVDFSSVAPEKGPTANDDFPLTEATGRSEIASSAESSSSDINKEDLALLKGWLGEEV